MRFALFELFQLTFSFQVSGKVAANGAENAEETAVEVRESISLPTVIGNLSSFLTLWNNDHLGVEWVPDSECENCVACGRRILTFQSSF